MIFSVSWHGDTNLVWGSWSLFKSAVILITTVIIHFGSFYIRIKYIYLFNNDLQENNICIFIAYKPTTLKSTSLPQTSPLNLKLIWKSLLEISNYQSFKTNMSQFPQICYSPHRVLRLQSLNWEMLESDKWSDKCQVYLWPKPGWRTCLAVEPHSRISTTTPTPRLNCDSHSQQLPIPHNTQARRAEKSSRQEKQEEADSLCLTSFPKFYQSGKSNY